MPAAYAAVGASKLPDLLRFPPDGSTPYEEALQLGSGQDRFLAASSLLMTWGAQRGTGIAVTQIDRGSDDEYVGPEFDDQGRAVAVNEVEEQFGPDGEPYLVAGTTAVLAAPGKPERSILIVYTVNEERVVGFAWGTSDEHGAIGEQRFTVEFREDDTVWAVARGFLTSPTNGLLGLKARSVIREAIDAARDQIGALAPGVAPVAPPAEPEEPDASGAADANGVADADGAADADEAAHPGDAAGAGDDGVAGADAPSEELAEVVEPEVVDPEDSAPEAVDPEGADPVDAHTDSAPDEAREDPASAPTDARTTHQRRPSRSHP